MPKSETRPRAVVLLSGGLDSATTLAEARAEGFDAYALTIDYGQRHAVEIECARRLAVVLGAVSHVVVPVDLTFAGASALTDPQIPVPRGRAPAEIGSGIPVTYVPARNTVFLSLALAWAETLRARDLFIGANIVDYSGYPDCRPEYIEAFQALARLATRTGVEGAAWLVHAPLMRLTKAEIATRAAELGLDLGPTLSCYIPDASGAPCGSCDACRLRARGFAVAGLPDPALAPIPGN